MVIVILISRLYQINMKVVVLSLFIISLLIVPIFVSADCNKSGTTVIFVNGMFTPNKLDADTNKRLLANAFESRSNLTNVTFLLGYNPSHAAGLGDMVNAVTQAYTGGYVDYDLKNILRQVHTDLKTQKIILMGHSQGTIYTNAAYDYLVSNGVDKNSIAVYNVGTPADVVAGNGKYLTSSTDKVINEIVKKLTTLGLARKPLPPNIDLKLSPDEEANSIGGHSFSDVYLAEAPDKIIGDIDYELNSLQESSSDKSECFNEPRTGVGYWITNHGYYFADGVVNNYDAFATSPSPSQMASITNSLFQGIYNFGQQIALSIAKIFNKNGFSEASASIPFNQLAQVAGDNTEVVSDNPDTEPAITSSEDSSAGQNTAAEQAMSYQDQLDDIQEKIDIIRQKIQELIAQQNQNDLIDKDKDETSDIKNDQDEDNNQDDNQNDNQNINNTGEIYPKILISEVQAAGTSDAKQEFVELYNPNDQDIDLTNWYLQRKTASASGWSTYVSSNLFSGRKIFAKGYFLIARTGYYTWLANIFTDNPITNDNSFVLKNPNGDISDKLGFGNVSDSELSSAQNPDDGQSIGRKFVSPTEQDTDNNSADFEKDTPTPKTNNIAYIPKASDGGGGGSASVTYPKILISEAQILPIEQRFVELYNPNSSDVSLTGWYLQRKTSSAAPAGSWSSFVSSTNFSGKIIPVNGYFLISRQLASSDILLDLTLSPDNSLAFKNPNGDISDELGWGQAPNSETSPTVNPDASQSIGRKVLDDFTEQDTDNNSADFELDTISPKAQNITYSPPTQGDTTAPVITLNGVSELTINTGDTYTDAGATATDNVDGDITSSIAVVNPVDTSTAAEYTITYNVSDAAGNYAVEVKRLIHVAVYVPKILITEVQIDSIVGTGGTNDDWVELYNPNGSDVSLKGWSVQKFSSDNPCSLNKGYYKKNFPDDAVLLLC